MQLRYAFFLLLLPLVTGQELFHYELHGTLNSVSAQHIREVKTNRAKYVDQESKIRTELSSLVTEDLHSFFVDEFQIHGDDVQRSTAIFYAFVSSTRTRDQFLDLVKNSNSLQLFFLREIEILPAVPATVDAFGPTCMNGAISLPNGTCYCPPFISGALCENVMCLNGGIADNNRCACPPGLYSVNCEPRGCLPQVQGNFDNSMQTFILVLNQRSSMAYVLNQIILNIGSSIDAIGGVNPNLVDNFILVNYIDSTNGYYMNKRAFTDRSSFTTYLTGITTSDGNPEQPTNRAIYTAQSFYPYIHGFSNIFVFADTPDVAINPPTFTITGNSDEVNAITQTIAWRNRIIYFFAQAKGSSLDTSMDDYDVFRRVAASTLGDIVSFDLKEIDEIIQHVLPAYKQNEVIAATYNNQPNQLAQSVVIPASDAGSIFVALTVEPNGILPTISSTPAPNVISLCNRFHLLQYPADSVTIKITSLTSAWSFRAFVGSSNTALLAYSMDPNIDIGFSYIPAELTPTVSGALIGFSGNPLLSMINNSGVASTPVTAQARSGECSFPLSFGNIANPIPAGPQMILVLAGGATRVIPGFSGYLDHHFAVPYNCFNGGTRTGPSACKCADQFEGNNCAIPKCQYGGYVNPFPGNGNPLCVCPQGFSGDHCEILTCNSTQTSFTFTNNRTLALVLQSTMSQAQINSKINNGLNTLINALQGADAFTQYVLTTFNNIIQNNQNYTDINTSSYANSNDFMNMARSDNVQYKASQTPNQDSYGALYKTMFITKNDKSSVFLFVDAPVESEFEKNFVIMSAIARQLEISILITPPYGMQDLCMSTTDAQHYADIAQKTGGVIVNLCNPTTGIYSTDPITQFFIGYAASHHHTENLNEVLDYKTGDSKLILKFYVDDPSNQVFVFVNSFKTESFTVTLDNLDNGQKTTLSPIATMPFLGIYSVTPSFGNMMGYLVTTTTGNQATSLRIAQKTQNAVYMGFSLDPSMDRQFTSMPYGSFFSPVVHLFGPALNGVTSPPSVTVTISTDDGDPIYSRTSVIRNPSCQYESYFTSSFVCPTVSNTYILTTNVTTSSATYQRTQRGYCYLQDGTCLNGGSYNYTAQMCECPGDYVGPNCEYPICQNGGQRTNFVCECLPGFAGSLCQYGTCETWNFLETHDVREQTFKQVTFVLNRNVDQLMVNVYLSYRIQEFVDQTESNYMPTQYSLITFDDLGVYDIVSSVHSSVFIQAFKSSINDGTRPAAAQTKAMDALFEAYKLNIQPPNIIYLFTGSDTTLTSQGVYNYLRQRIGTQVNLFYTPAQVANGFPDQPTGNLKTYLTLAARQSGGRVLPLTQNSVSSITPVLISSKSETSLIHDDAAKDCSAGAKFNFFVESNVISVVLDITGNGVKNAQNVIISVGSRNNVTIQPSNILFSDDAAIVYSIGRSDIPVADQMWTVTVKTISGSCFIQARAASPIRVIPGFTSSPTQDFVKSAPFAFQTTNYDQMTYMTFRVVDNGFADSYGTELNTVTIFQTEYYQSWVNYPILRDLKITARDPTNCANQFIAGPWKVDAAGHQKFIVTGKTSDNSQFQRTFYFSLPNTKNDDKPTCVHGTRNAHGECICEVRYSGGYCADPICDNGGTTSYGICACANGYFGDYCDQYIIATPTNTTTASPVF